MSTTQVTISTPRVHTLQVTVRALRIGTKQVTQSVFRQLPRRSVWDPMTGQLQGTPWGLVNYFWHDCGPTWPERPHLHVVWQAGERLFRDCVFNPQRSIPAGVAAAKEQVDAAQQRCLRAAGLIWAVTLLARGYEGKAVQLPAVLRLDWPCGVQTRFRWEQVEQEIFARHEAHLGHRLHSLVIQLDPERHDYRQEMTETRTQPTQPEGAGWYHRYPRSPEMWHRPRPESDAEWRARTTNAFTKRFAAIETAVATEIATHWTDYAIPADPEQAKLVLNPLAQACLTTQAHLDQLVKVFDAAYERLEELDQLFIAV